MRTFIAGIDVDRRLWRDLLRPLRVVPAPPKLGELALRLQHQASAQHQHPKPNLGRSRMSLCLLRTLLPRVMTATEGSLWADSATH